MLFQTKAKKQETHCKNKENAHAHTHTHTNGPPTQFDARESARSCGLKRVFTQKESPHTEKKGHPDTICPPTCGFYGGTGEHEQQGNPGHPPKTNAKTTLFRESARSCPRTFCPPKSKTMITI